MGLILGCIGLPNVGKSTLFNTLTANNIAAENYPFCTIEPNFGITLVPDDRLKTLANIVHSREIIPAALSVIDIAGLVKGASKGEGLGNQFLSHVKQADLLFQVVRFFDDPNIVHVHQRVDPLVDAQVIETELILKDLETVEKLRGKKGVESKYVALLDRIYTILNKGEKINKEIYNEDEQLFLNGLELLTLKPMIYVLNVSESQAGEDIVVPELFPSITLSIKLESEIATIQDMEMKQELLQDYGLQSTALDRLVRLSFDTLGLISFFTAGEKEVRAWPIGRGTKAPQAAGVIHTDFEKGFIRMEVVKYYDFVQYGGWEGAKAAGKMSVEGKDYEVEDGDVIIVRHSA